MNGTAHAAENMFRCALKISFREYLWNDPAVFAVLRLVSLEAPAHISGGKCCYTFQNHSIFRKIDNSAIEIGIS